MKSTEQLEREGEQTRERINDTLDELRARVTPGQIVDEVVDYARTTGGAAFARNLRQQVVDNPLPVALMGASLVWLMAMNRSGRRTRIADFDTPDYDASDYDVREDARRARDAGRELAGSARSSARGWLRRGSVAASEARSAVSGASDSVRDAASRTGNAVRSAAASASDSVRSAMADATDRLRSVMTDASDGASAAGSRSSEVASSLIDSVRARAASTYDNASSVTRRASCAIGDAASAIGDTTVAVGRSLGGRSQQFADFCRDQPLMVAGLGLAVGAALGAGLPVSETEDRLLGEVSDDIKDRMQRVADKVKEGAKSAYDQVAESTSAADQASGDKNRHTRARGGNSDAQRPAGEDATSELHARDTSGGSRAIAGGATSSGTMDDPAAMRGDEDELKSTEPKRAS